MVETRKRVYESALRTDQARRTRWTIVQAAARLFARDGFAATSIDAIAQEAGVSRKTVFTSVGGKVELLKLAYDVTMAGDDEPVSMSDRPELQRVIGEPDTYRAFALWAGVATDIGERICRLYLALRGAAEVDPAARELYLKWEQERLQSMHDGPVARVQAEGLLRDDVRPAEAASILNALTVPALYDEFVNQQGWSRTRFREWLSRTMTEQVLKPRPP